MTMAILLAIAALSGTLHSLTAIVCGDSGTVIKLILGQHHFAMAGPSIHSIFNFSSKFLIHGIDYQY